jgi:hypothetical protein
MDKKTNDFLNFIEILRMERCESTHLTPPIVFIAWYAGKIVQFQVPLSYESHVSGSLILFSALHASAHRDGYY